MTFDPERRHRRSIRLPAYDYSQAGAYFVTLCAYNRECLFGNIVDGAMHLNEAGEIVAYEWTRSSEIRREVGLDEWVLIPNHFHGIVVLAEAEGPDGHAEEERTGRPEEGRTGRAPLRRRPRSLSSLIAGFKATSTRRTNDLRRTPGTPIWQRNYYEHVIRSEASLHAIRRYISENPLRWANDEENPTNIARNR